MVRMLQARHGQEGAVATAVGPFAQLLRRDREEDSSRLSLPRSSHAVLDRIRAITHHLEVDPGLTAREVAERIGLPRRHAVLLLLRLEEHGVVEHDGRRWFAAAAVPEMVR